MATKKDEKSAASKQLVEHEFSKEQLLSADRFQDRKDIVTAILSRYPDSVTLTANAVEKMINDYMKGQVR